VGYQMDKALERLWENQSQHRRDRPVFEAGIPVEMSVEQAQVSQQSLYRRMSWMYNN